MEPSTMHIASLVATFIVTLLPGIIASRKIKSADDYSVGGRSSSAMLVAGGIIGTIVGGAATVGTAQLGFNLGLTAWWFTLGGGIGLLIMAFFYAVPLRQSGLTTISEFLVGNYGPTAGFFSSLSAAAGIFFSIVASTLTALHLVTSILNVSLLSSAVIIVFIVMGLVFFGGISGSGMAGLLKIVFIFATIFVGGLLAYNYAGKWQGLHAVLADYPWFSLFGSGVQDGIYSLLSMIVGVISTQTYVQAIFSAKDSRTAAIGCVTAALIVIPVGLPSVMIGVFMRITNPDINSIDALPLYLLTYLPDWLGGIGIGAVLLSSLGSIAGLALGVGTMLSRDIIKNVWRKIDSIQLLCVGRISVLLVTVCAVVFVFYHLDSSVLQWNYLSMALRASGIFLPLTFAVFFQGKVCPKAGIVAIIVGILVACFWEHIFDSEINGLFPALGANLLVLLAGLFYGRGWKISH